MGIFVSARKETADAYLPQELKILSDYFGFAPEKIREASFSEDVEQATDLVLPNGTRIAKRCRTPKQLRFSGDIIFRHPPEAVRTCETEWDKVLSGYGDYTLYSIAADATTIAKWWLLDLSVLRYHHRNAWRFCIPPQYIEKSSEDAFMVIKANGFPSWPPPVVASSETISHTDWMPGCEAETMQRWYHFT